MLLNNVLRPRVIFDASNKTHRAHYAKFLKERTWGSCPIRFEVVDERLNNNLAFAMQRLLAEYYLTEEFQITVDS
jgi:hypothetical protein